jgi:hypothetical protein
MKEIILEDPAKTEIINTRAGFANREQLWYLGEKGNHPEIYFNDCYQLAES